MTHSSPSAKPRVAVHKFSSCDGCQLAFLNAGERLLELTERVDIVHFVEAGIDGPDEEVDIAFVEGSISTAEEQQRIQRVRTLSQYVITIGACATSGGLQALRNFADAEEWKTAIYAKPEFIHSLQQVTSVADNIKVDFELWGCPVNRRQVFAAIRSLLYGVAPEDERDKVCMQCKRNQTQCVVVTKGQPCMGPVTRTGCGALCPSFGRACYACYGPAESCNTSSLATRFVGLGWLPQQIKHQFQLITSTANEFQQAASNIVTDDKP